MPAQPKRGDELPEIALNVAPEPSLAVTQPHVAPAAAQKKKQARTVSSRKKKLEHKKMEKAAERGQKIEKRREGVSKRIEKKKRAKSLWE